MNLALLIDPYPFNATRWDRELTVEARSKLVGRAGLFHGFTYLTWRQLEPAQRLRLVIAWYDFAEFGTPYQAALHPLLNPSWQAPAAEPVSGGAGVRSTPESPSGSLPVTSP